MDKIKVYYLLTDEIDNIEEVLEKAEKKVPLWRKGSIAKSNIRARFNGAIVYLLLQKLIFSEYGMTDLNPFKYGERGKPFFSEIPLYFSMSHSKCAVGAAVSETEVGFDITDSRIIREETAKRICSPDEYEDFEKAANKQRFLRLLWCKKESLVKRTGEGFSKDFKDIDTTFGRYYFYDTEKYCFSVNWESGDRDTEVKTLCLGDII